MTQSVICRDDAEVTKYVLICENKLERLKVNEREMLQKVSKLVCLKKGKKMVFFIRVIYLVDGAL